jgi:hypothetical protein
VDFLGRPYEDLEKLKASLGRSGALGHVCWFLGIVFAVLGIIGDAANVKIGLEPESWLLLAIVASVLSVSLFIGWAVAWYLRSIEAKSERKD